MIRRKAVTSIETLELLLSDNAELKAKVLKLEAALEEQDSLLAQLQTRLERIWDIQENIDYRSLVDQIREESRAVGDAIRALDLGTQKQLARLAPASDANGNRKLLPSVHSLLRTLDKWK